MMGEGAEHERNSHAGMDSSCPVQVLLEDYVHERTQRTHHLPRSLGMSWGAWRHRKIVSVTRPSGKLVGAVRAPGNLEHDCNNHSRGLYTF